MIHLKPGEVVPTMEEEEARGKLLKRRWLMFLIPFGILICIGTIFWVQQRLETKGQAHYQPPNDTVRVIYIVEEPNPQSALVRAKQTMRTTSPQFSAVVFITPAPEQIPAHDPIVPDIAYLTAPDETTAVKRAIEFATQANWSVLHRHLYYSFTSSGRLDTLMDQATRDNIFTGRARVSLADAK